MGHKDVSAAFLVLLLFSVPLFGGEDAYEQPEALVREIYTAISSTPGSTPDWDRVRSFFDEDALIVLRGTGDDSKKTDLEGFIQDFKAFYDRIDPETTTFTEKIVSLKALEYGNIAQVYVVFEVSVKPSERPPQRGLDSWHLMKSDGKWKVISVVNDNENAAGPIPEEAFAG